MKNSRRVIRESLLFNGLQEAHLSKVETIAVEKSVKKGETIFYEGDEGVGFYLIVSGQVKIFKLSGEGKEHILHIFGAGESIGEVPVFSGRPYPATAQSIAESQALFFQRKAFVDLISAEPSLAMNMLAVLSKRLHQFAVQIENLSLKEAPGRLASYLIYLLGETEEKNRLDLKISKGQLAGLLGTIPETLSRVFLRMSKQKIINVKGKEIEILNLQALKDLAEYGRLIDDL